MSSWTSQRLGLPAPWHSPSFISVCHGCSVSKARVVFAGGSYSTGTLRGSQGIQTKGVQLGTGRLREGQLWKGHGTGIRPRDQHGKAKHAGIPWCSGEEWQQDVCLPYLVRTSRSLNWVPTIFACPSRTVLRPQECC